MTKEIPYIYYYIDENGEKIPLASGTSLDFNHLLFLDETKISRYESNAYTRELDLYLFIDGEHFKVWSAS